MRRVVPVTCCIYCWRQAADEAFNVFHPLTYEGAVDTEREIDPLRRAALQIQISEFGQTPRQIFKSSHPIRTGPVIPAQVPVAAPTDSNGNEDVTVDEYGEPVDDTAAASHEASPTDLATDFVLGRGIASTPDATADAANGLQVAEAFASPLSDWSPVNILADGQPEAYLRQARLGTE